MIDTALFTDFLRTDDGTGILEARDEFPIGVRHVLRRQPFNGGYSVFAGLDPLIDTIESFRFSGEDLAYLEGLGVFERGFLDWLADFRFAGDLWAMDEGTIVFPNEPCSASTRTSSRPPLSRGLSLTRSTSKA
jgi:nicotinate phosphoribosyltransferase